MALIFLDIIFTIIFIIAGIIHFLIYKYNKIVVYLAMGFYLIYVFYNTYRINYPEKDKEGQDVKDLSSFINSFGMIFGIAAFIFGLYKYIEPTTIDGIDKKIKKIYQNLFESLYKKREIIYKTANQDYNPQNDIQHLLKLDKPQPNDIINQGLLKAQSYINKTEANLLKFKTQPIIAPRQPQFASQPQFAPPSQFAPPPYAAQPQFTQPQLPQNVSPRPLKVVQGNA